MSSIGRQLKEQVRQVAANNQNSTPSMPLAKQSVRSKSINVFGDSGSFKDAQRMANALATADFTPETFRGKMANCLLALEMANRMGASVVAIMQNMYIVKGRPAWSAAYIIAAINTSGRFQTSLMYETESDSKGNIIGCHAYATDKQNNRLEGPKVTMKMVQAEGWTSNAKWKNMPDVMFRYRAASFFGKMYTPDILMGMQTVEEIEDVYDVQATPTPQTPRHDATQPDQTQRTSTKGQEYVDAEIEDENDLGSPPYMDDKRTDPSDIKIPIIEALDDIGSFIRSLGLDMEVKQTAKKDRHIAGLSGNTDGLDEILQEIGFSFKKTIWIRDVSDLILEEEAKGLF